MFIFFNSLQKIMVSEVNGNYMCDDCKLLYKEKEWADKCEEWCLRTKSCNIEITKHRIVE